MAFTNDGTVHRQAIKNENALAVQLQNLPHDDQMIIFGEVVESAVHKGGTKNKADVLVTTKTREIGVSDKSKNNIKSGSFDYINTTNDVSKFFPETCKVYLEGKDSGNDAFNNVLRKAITDEVNNLSDDNLTKFIADNVINHYNNIHVCLTDLKSKTSYFFEGRELNFIKLFEDGYSFRIKQSKKQSKQIVLVKGDDVINTGLRIRLMLNNGHSLWIKSKNGRSSTLCLHIQQDKTNKIIPAKSVKFNRTII